MDPDLKPLQEVCRENGMSIDRARYWLSLLKVTPVKRDGVRLVPIEVITQLAGMSKLVTEGASPANAADRVRMAPTDVQVGHLVTRSPAPVTTDTEALDCRLESMERAMLAMADHLAKLGAEVTSLRRPAQIPVELTAPTVPIRPWHPTAQKRTVTDWWTRTWCHLVDPAKLRRT